MSNPSSPLYPKYDTTDTTGVLHGKIPAVVVVYPSSDGSEIAQMPPGTSASNPMYVTGGGGGGGGSAPAGTVGTSATGTNAASPVFDAATGKGLLTAGSIVSITQADQRQTGQTIAAGTANAALIVALSNAEGTVGFTVSGLTASAAVLAVEASNDGGSTWSAINSVAPGTGTISTTLTADGQFRVNSGGHTNVRLRVSTTGSGTITVSSNASSVSSLIGISAPLPNDGTPATGVTQMAGGTGNLGWQSGIYAQLGHLTDGSLKAGIQYGGAYLGPGNPLPVAETPRTYSPVATSTVATGGTAVTAFPAGSLMRGAVLKNPGAATEMLYFALGTNAGTAEIGATMGLAPGASYQFPFGTAASVTVNAATSGHAFCGYSY